MLIKTSSRFISSRLGLYLQRRTYYSNSSKVVSTIEAALKGIRSNITLLSGGFGICGLPEMLIDGLLETKVKNITAVSNNAGIDGRGLSKLLESGQITKMISSYIGNNKTFERMYLNGDIKLELCPQGSIAERCRAAAAGIPAYYVATGVGTWVEDGQLPVLYGANGRVLETTKPRESRFFNGKKYLLEEAIYGDVAFIKAYKVDTLGNCWFRGSARNFNSIFGRAAALTIVEAEHIVNPGDIEPENVHLPGLYVHRIIKSNREKDIETLKLRKSENSQKVDEKDNNRTRIAKRAAKELLNVKYVNLGIGIPTLVPSYLNSDSHIIFQSENGLLGVGGYPCETEVDPDLINAGKETVTLKKGASLFGSEESFAMIRSGKINLTILGGLQVSQKGDLANWSFPGRIKGMGGAMDLVSNPNNTRVVIIMEHIDRDGNPKIVKECTYPLTGVSCVSRIITDLAVFDVMANGLVLIEISSSTTLEEVKKSTEAEFIVDEELSYF